MNAVDTNVLLYEIDADEPIKQAKAQRLLRGWQSDPRETILLWQVLAEFVSQLRSWQSRGRIQAGDLKRYVQVTRGVFPLVLPTSRVMDHALHLSDRDSLSHWDSMILGACLEAGVDTLFTEDMGAPRVIDGIRLFNPFT